MLSFKADYKLTSSFFGMLNCQCRGDELSKSLPGMIAGADPITRDGPSDALRFVIVLGGAEMFLDFHLNIPTIIHDTTYKPCTRSMT
jgi:hypothetical protein